MLRAPVGQADRHPASWATPTHFAPSRRTCWSRAASRIVWSRPGAPRPLARRSGPHPLRQACSEWSPRAAEDRIGRDRARPPRQPPRVPAAQHPHRVRPQQDAGADLAHLGGLLENHNLKSGVAQGNRCAEPTDASADDDDLPRPVRISRQRQPHLSCLTLRAGMAPRIGGFAGHAASARSTSTTGRRPHLAAWPAYASAPGPES